MPELGYEFLKATHQAWYLQQRLRHDKDNSQLKKDFERSEKQAKEYGVLYNEYAIDLVHHTIFLNINKLPITA